MSNEIDDRVVSLSFDNSKFNKNVTDTMDSLDALKKKLQFDSAGDSFKAIEEASEKVNFKSMENNIDKIADKFSVLGIMGKRALENITDSLMSTVTNTFGKVTSFVKNGIVQGGLNRAMNLEKAHFQLQGLLKDEKEVQAVMADVDAAVSGTAYGLDAAALVASQLAASGMRAGDEMASTLKAIAGVAAMTSSEYGEIGRIFTQVAGNGRLMGDQLLQLSVRGINAAATMADYYNKLDETLHVTEADIRDLVSDGKISFEDFAAAMDDAFGEHAKKANETVDGVYKNLKSAFGRIGALFVSPMIEQNGPLVKMLDAIRLKVNDIKAELVPIAETVTTKLNGTIEKITEKIEKLDFRSAYTKFSDNLKAAGTDMDTFQKALAAVLKEDGKNLDDIISKYGSLRKAFKKGAIAKNTIIKALQRIGKPLKDTADATAKLKHSWEELDKISWRVIRGDFSVGAERMKMLADEGWDYATVQDLVNRKMWKMSYSAEDYADALAGMAEEEDINTKTIAEMAEAMNDADSEMSKIWKAMSTESGKAIIFESLSNIVIGLSQRLKALGEAFSEVFFNGRTEASAERMYKLLDAFRTFSEKFLVSDEKFEKIKDTFVGLFDVLDLVRRALTFGLNVALRAILGVLNAFNISAIDLSASLGKLIDRFHDWITSQNLVTKVSTKLTKILTTIVTALKKVVTKVRETELFHKIWSKILTVVQNVKKEFPALVASFKEFGSLKFESLTKAFESIKDFFVKIFTGGKDAKKSGEDTGDAVESIGDAAEAASVKTESALDVIFNAFKRLFDYITTEVQPVRKILEVFNHIWTEFTNGTLEFADVFTLILGLGAVKFGKAIVKVLGSVTGIMGGVESLVRSCAGVVTSFKYVLESLNTSIRVNIVFKIALAITALAAAMLLLSKIPAKDLTRVAIASGVAAAALSGVAWAISFFMKSMTLAVSAGIGVSLMGFAAAIATLTLALFALSCIKMDHTFTKRLTVLVEIIVGLMIATEALAFVTKDFNVSGMKSAMTMIAAFGASIYIITLALIKIGEIPTDHIWESITAMAVILGGMVALGAIMSKLGKEKTDYTSGSIAFFGIAGSMLIMGYALEKLASVKLDKVKANIIPIAATLGSLLVMISLATKMKTEIGKSGMVFMGMASSLVVMAFCINLLGKLDAMVAAQGIIAIDALLLGLGLALSFAKKSPYDMWQAGVYFSGAAIMIGAMATAAILLSRLKLLDLIKGVSAISIMTLVMAKMIEMMDGIDSVNIASLKGVPGVILMIVGCAVALGFVPFGQLVKGVAAVSVLALILGGLIYLTKFAPSNEDNKALQNVRSMVLLLIGLVAAVAVLCIAMGNVPDTNAAASVAIMSASIAGMAGVMYLLSKIDMNWERVKAPLGAMAAVAAGAVLLAFILSDSHIKVKTSTLVALGTLIGTLAGATALFSKVKVDFVSAVEGMFAILVVIAVAAIVTGVLADLIGGIASDGAMGRIEKGASIIISIFGIMGECVGAFVGGISFAFTEQMADSFENIIKIAEAASGMKDDSLKGLKAMKNFFKTMVGIKFWSWLAKFDGDVANAADLMNGSDTSGNTNTLEGFKAKLKSYGELLVEFAESIKDLSNDDAKKISRCANAIKSFSDVEKALADKQIKSNILLADETPDSIQKFGDRLKAYGEALVEFNTSIADLDVSSSSQLQSVVDFTNTLSTMEQNMPDCSSIMAKISGYGDMSEFGKRLSIFGAAMVDFSKTIQGTRDYSTDLGHDFDWFTGKQWTFDIKGGWNGDGLLEKVTNIVEIVNKLAEMDVPETSFIKKLWSGEVDYSAFGKDLNGFVGEICGVADVLGGNAGLDDDDYTNLENVITVMGKFSDLATQFETAKDVDFTDIANGLSSFCTVVRDQCRKTEIDDGKLNKLLTSIGTIFSRFYGWSLTYDYQGISDSCDLIKKAAEVMGYINECSLNGDTASLFMDNIESINAQAVGEAFTGATKAMVDAASGFKGKMTTLGKDCIQGFINGLTDEAKLVEVGKAGTTIGEKALEYAKKAVDSNSPAKKFEELGKFCDEGMVIGINGDTKAVGEAAAEMGETAMIGVQTAIDGINKLMDASNTFMPTITPVIDMNGLSSASAGIDSMFNNANVGINAQLDMANQQAHQDMLDQNEILRSILGAINAGGTVTIDGNKLIGWIDTKLGKID